MPAGQAWRLKNRGFFKVSTGLTVRNGVPWLRIMKTELRFYVSELRFVKP
jgi:hypothetical protein